MGEKVQDMSPDPQITDEAQTGAFTALVEDGTFTADFEHGETLKAFVGAVMAEILPGRASNPAILDAGCGTGAWLAYLAHDILPAHNITASLYGFDLTPAMAEVAAERLNGVHPGGQIHTGSLLDPAAYRFPDGRAEYDVIFVFDVIQQLPRRHQMQAVQEVLRHLTPNGVAVIFDHDRHSRYGRKMGIRKFLTWYFHIPLMPRYYCNAQYPPLEKMRRRIAGDRNFDAYIRSNAENPKQALVITRMGGHRQHDD